MLLGDEIMSFGFGLRFIEEVSLEVRMFFEIWQAEVEIALLLRDTPSDFRGFSVAPGEKRHFNDCHSHRDLSVFIISSRYRKTSYLAALPSNCDVQQNSLSNEKSSQPRCDLQQKPISDLRNATKSCAKTLIAQ